MSKKKIELRPLISGFDFALLEVRNLCVASRLWCDWLRGMWLCQLNIERFFPRHIFRRRDAWNRSLEKYRFSPFFLHGKAVKNDQSLACENKLVINIKKNMNYGYFNVSQQVFLRYRIADDFVYIVMKRHLCVESRLSDS